MYYGQLKKVEFVQLEGKNGNNKGKKFTLVKYEVDVKVDTEKSIIKTYKGSMGLEYAKEYFKHCGFSSKTAIGQEVGVTLQKREWLNKDGDIVVTTEVKYLNFLDSEGNAIMLPKDEENLPF